MTLMLRISRSLIVPALNRTAAIFAVAAAYLCLTAPQANAATNCIFTLLPLAFGEYVPGDTTPRDITGSIDVSCRGSAGAFSLSISTGTSGSFLAREMASGTNRMQYNIFIDSARTLIWGDGTGGSVIQSGVKPVAGRQDFNFPTYGRIPPQQSVGAGNYIDDVLVTIVF